MKTIRSKHFAVACGFTFVAACGVLGDKNTTGPVDQPIGTVQAAQTSASAAPAFFEGTASAIPMADFPLDENCVHRKADGKCILPSLDDQDADGVPARLDCNDRDPYVYPGAPEVKCDSIDDDCDGKDFCPVDRDGDGFSPPTDCDDADGARNPNQPEIWCNGVDEDCDGKDDCDRDGDRVPESEDCNDRDPSISPTTPEILCDGIDQNCDGTDCCDNDQDGDGAPCSYDCDDYDPKTYPGAPVQSGCYFKDVNCDGDLDGICRR